MNDNDLNLLESGISDGKDVSPIIANMIAPGIIAKDVGLLIKADDPGFVTYCPGGIDPATGQCHNNGLRVPDPLGHMAGLLLLHSAGRLDGA